MSFIFRWSCIVICFFVRIEVRAGEPTDMDLLFLEPANCLEKLSYPCAVYNPKLYKAEIHIPGFKVIMSKKSMLILSSEKDLKIFEGHYLIQSLQDFSKLTSLVGSLELYRFSETYIEAGKKAVSLYSLRRGVSYYMNGIRHFLPVGYELDHKLGSVSFPRAVKLNTLFSKWMKLFDGDTETFKRRLEAFRLDWQIASQTSQYITKREINRLLAAEDRQKKVAIDRRKRWLIEKRRLRKLYERKVFHE